MENTTTTSGAAERFTKSYDQLIRLGLSPRLVLLYGKLAFHAGNDGRCFAKWDTLAQEIGLKGEHRRITVCRLLRRLKVLKLVEWEQRPGRYDSNQYRVLTPDIAFLEGQGLHGCYASDVGEKLRQTLQKSYVSDVAEMLPRKESIKVVEKKSLKEGQSKLPGLCAPEGARAGESALAKISPRAHGYRPEWFDQWWAIYWRKVARKPAEKAFRNAVTTAERFAQVMDATRTQKPAMMQRDPAHRPHGATWLNQERWTDEPSAPATAKKPASLADRTMNQMLKRLARGERPL